MGLGIFPREQARHSLGLSNAHQCRYRARGERDHLAIGSANLAPSAVTIPVSYTHLTLPPSDLV